MFPKGDSLQGVSDLAGNVWEWCLNEYDKPDRVGVTGDASRVLRGGSWFNTQDHARAVHRYNLDPLNPYRYLGFRVVVSSPIRKR
jgi:formylglycine-generating enzyme required for sulfatase activity